MKIPLNLVQSEALRLESQRQCGTCTACCVLPRIPIGEDPDLPEGKRGYTPCKHLRWHNCTPPHGCGIYEHRPQLCRDYKCLWRAGIIVGDERRRPDNLGLMFTLDVVTEDGREQGVVEAWELWDGAARNNPGRWVLDSLAQYARVHIRFYGVPAAIKYESSESIDKLGWALSTASAIDPQALARWLERNITLEGLTVDNLESVMRDLKPLKRGEPVVRHYQPK